MMLCLGTLLQATTHTFLVQKKNSLQKLICTETSRAFSRKAHSSVFCCKIGLVLYMSNVTSENSPNTRWSRLVLWLLIKNETQLATATTTPRCFQAQLCLDLFLLMGGYNANHCTTMPQCLKEQIGVSLLFLLLFPIEAILMLRGLACTTRTVWAAIILLWRGSDVLMFALWLAQTIELGFSGGTVIKLWNDRSSSRVVEKW